MVRLFPIHESITKQWWNYTNVDLQYQYRNHQQQQHHLHGDLRATDSVQSSNNFTNIGRGFFCVQAHRPHSYGIYYGENPMQHSFDTFLFELVLIVFATHLFRFFLKPFNQPKFVSEILGGIIVGPSVLSRIDVFRQNIFPDNSLFVIKNVGMIGFVYFLFVAGVEIDLILVKNVGKKHLYTAFVGSLVPFISMCTVAVVIRSSMEKGLARISGFGAVATSFSLTLYPVLHIILKDLNLLSSEVGRIAAPSAIIGDSLGIFGIVFFDALKAAENDGLDVLWFLITIVTLGAVLICCVRPLMFWIIRRTPEGKPVDQLYITLILLGVLVVGFLTDMSGIGLGTGPLWFGLVIPSGPPLGATLVDRSKTITADLLLPMGFALIGQFTDVFSMIAYGWSKLFPLFAMIATGYLTKAASTFIVALNIGLPWRDSLALSFVMNLRGHIDLVLFHHWVDKNIILLPMFSMLVVVITICTAVLTYLITVLYDPTRPYMVNKRRTVQHCAPGTELQMVVCIPDEDSFNGLINLLEIAYPTETSPLSIYALHLIELVGRATPFTIDHNEQPPHDPMMHSEHIETMKNALKRYEDARADYVEASLYTAGTAKRSMYQDVCKLAMDKKANLIILPFDNAGLESVGGSEMGSQAHKPRSINIEVIDHAPCSVAILVEKQHITAAVVAQGSHPVPAQNIVMLFMGGADAREALAIADRMATNPDVTLRVLRFLTSNNEGDDEIEKRLDDGVVTWFWVKNEGNKRVLYREVVVSNGRDTIGAIHALDLDTIDLWVVGRQEGINPTIIEGLTEWTQNPELGLIGDFLASADFGRSSSVLIVHQQVMRG